MKDAGFNVKVKQVDVTDESDDGLVQTQNPTGGTADVGSTVTITVGNFPEDGRVP